MRRYLPRPHQTVLLIGFLAALGTLASGIAPELTGWHHDSPIQREVFFNIPRPLEVAFYLAVATGLFLVSWLVSLRVRNYERGKPDNRRTNKGNLHRRMRDFRRGVWMRTLLRDPAAGIMHSFIYFGFLVLFVITVVLEIDHQLPGSLKFLHGRTYEALRVHRRPVRAHLPHRDPVGVRPAVRPAPLPDPHQDQARAPRDPGDVPRHRRHRVHHRGLPHRGAAQRDRPGGELREVVLRRLGALARRRRLDPRRAAGRAPLVLGRPRRRVPRLPRDPADHDAAPHDHEPDEHVPEGPPAPQGRDARDAEPHGDRARDVRRVDGRGLHLEAAVRHGRLHDLWAVHVRVPGARDRASPSTRARSC